MCLTSRGHSLIHIKFTQLEWDIGSDFVVVAEMAEDFFPFWAVEFPQRFTTATTLTSLKESA